jgi:hypothetical protein
VACHTQTAGKGVLGKYCNVPLHGTIDLFGLAPGRPDARAYCLPTRLTRSLCMRPETALATHFPGCMRPMEGTRAPRLRLPLCLGGPHNTCMQLPHARWHAAAASVHALLLLLSSRAAAAVPIGRAPPAAAVRMRLPMNLGGAMPALLPTCMRGPPPSAPSSRA